jgi:hypothetical protein
MTSRPARRLERRVIDIADTVHANLVVCPHVVSMLKSIHAKYPTLRFGDFVTAMHLVELATREPGGNA